MFLGDLRNIVEAFKMTGARVLFGAEVFCWPDETLASKYPKIERGKPYLNSGLYMGYMPEIWELLQRKDIEDTDDDQLFFTEAYLDENVRERLKFKLDHESQIFQNLNGAINEVQLLGEGKEHDIRVKNVITHTEPLIVHGNGPSKIRLNYLGNYISKAWSVDKNCKHCTYGLINLTNIYDSNVPTVFMALFIEQATPFLEEQLQKLHDGLINLTNIYDSNVPTVFMALFIEQATPFLEEQLQKLHDQYYPKKRIHLFIHNAVKYHKTHINEFLAKYKKDYLSVKEITPEDGTSEWSARDLSLDQCVLKDCDYYFAIDSLSHLDSPYTLKLLIEQNRTVVAPLLVRSGKAWSNFWGALTTDGFYSRSDDYMDIVYNNKRGLWNVPFINSAYLVNGTLLKKTDRSKLSFVRGDLDADMAFCGYLRDLDVFMFVSNRLDFGHLVNPETYDTTRMTPDMYQIFENEIDWEDRYIHSDYPENLNPDNKLSEPCPDVYWFPIVSLRFCKDLIAMMENFGIWSDGKNEDTRLDGGYEAVPTRDIHMNQVGWERHWLYFLQKYVRPLQEHVFLGYFHNPPRSLMNFVVRYRPDEQPSLRPHHDSSTYTINIALNERGVDYEGGGCRFIRYNCSVVDTKPGWLLIHPGRLTHFHEGLLVTKGTRYIMVAFVDP
ncbi:hypothetical protein AMK59_4922 [Oryctes borbonicus]|uniref:Fe2OG dioxygenase domain-containing protein n=1 Tax=Oryctes borbonicus TaxID=1629725 RepID=A0A0T6B0C6_9SCAR|nr:hypothetical protein AMK59_4922 [Oryctes borbonicus]